MTHTERLDEVIAGYRKDHDAGRGADRETLLARHPDLAADLRRFFADEDLVAGLGAGPAAGTAAAAPDDALPRPFGDYELLEEIGRGGMGVVYKARQRGLNRTVALKMICGVPSADARHRFQREAEIVARLNDKRVVPIYEVGEHEGRPFYSMELVPGGSLARQLGRFADDPRAAAELVRAAAEAVQHAHEHGVIHRDLKPANVLLAEDDTPRIADFGLAKRLDDTPDGPGSLAGDVIGTFQYMAPEQARGEKNVGVWADQYGLGAVLYALLTGRPPAEGATPAETLDRVLHGEPTTPRRLRPGVPPDLEAICLKCLEKEPRRRYASAQALADDLRRFRDGEPTRARPVGPATRAWMWVRRRRGWAALWALAATLAVLLGFSWVGELNAERRHAVEKAAIARDLLGQAEAERDQARQERDRVKLALGTVQVMLVRATQDERRSLSQAEKVRGLLDATEPLIERLAREVQVDPKQRLPVGQLYVVRGEGYRLMGEPGRAVVELRRAVELLSALAESNPLEPEYRAEHAAALQTLALALQQNGQPQAAEENYLEARKLLLGLVERHRDNVTCLRYAAHTEGNLAQFYLTRRRDDEALGLHRQVLARLEKLVTLPGATPQDRQRLAKTLDNLGVAHANKAVAGLGGGPAEQKRARELADTAGRYFESAQTIREALVKASPRELSFKADLATSCGNRAVWSLKFRQSPEGQKKAVELLREAVRINEPLTAELPHFPEHAKALVGNHANLAAVYQARGEHDSAQDALLAAAGAGDRLARRFPRDPEAQALFLQAVERLVVGSGEQGGASRLQASVFLTTAVSVWEALASEEPERQATLKKLRALQRQFPEDKPDFRFGGLGGGL
jgi:tetratricopeptide (TPR) repeat protein/tRNA A-37 threonylcarbamoyl transferase component Bud32